MVQTAADRHVMSNGFGTSGGGGMPSVYSSGRLQDQDRGGSMVSVQWNSRGAQSTSDVFLLRGSSATKGFSIIVNIIKGVHRVIFFCDPLPPSQKSNLKFFTFNNPV